MPTASKLAAALAFAVISYFAASAFALHMPEGSNPGTIREVSAVVGAIVGWYIWGEEHIHKDISGLVGVGIRTTIVTVFWVLLIFAITLMIRKSGRMMYDGPMDAVLGIFEMMLEQGYELRYPDVLAILGLGGALGGVFAGWAGRRWK